MKPTENILYKFSSVALIIMMVFSAFTIVIADNNGNSKTRSARTVTQLKLKIEIGDWDLDSDNPDINITTIDQSNNTLNYVNIFGTGIPQMSQTNDSGEYILYDQPAGQYKFGADYYNGQNQLFTEDELLLRMPSTVFLYTDIGTGPFDADYSGNKLFIIIKNGQFLFIMYIYCKLSLGKSF